MHYAWQAVFFFFSKPSVFRLLPSVFRHLSSALCLLSTVICLPSSELGAAAGITAPDSPENPARAIIPRLVQIHILMRFEIFQAHVAYLR